MIIDDIRREYDRNNQHIDGLDTNPHDVFTHWLNDAIASAELIDPTAMVLATSDTQHHITQRIVLLKDSSEQGYVFYTNYHSRKAQALLEQPQCSLHFAWLPLERQVSITGIAKKISAHDSDQYFASRPRASQLAAWASQQSQPIASRQALDASYERMEQRFSNNEPIPRPQGWGGFIVEPTHYEFWQGGVARLHDRFIYQRSRATKGWQQERIQP